MMQLILPSVEMVQAFKKVNYVVPTAYSKGAATFSAVSGLPGLRRIRFEEA
jgi:hypothetical protein